MTRYIDRDACLTRARERGRRAMIVWNRSLHMSRPIRRAGALAVILAILAAGLPLPFDRARQVPAATSGGGSGLPIEVPEHPEGTAFNPNQLKDITAANPGAGVNLISPPAANNMGEAHLSYPLEVPPGRAGM